MAWITLLKLVVEGVVKLLPFLLVSNKSEQVGELKAENEIQKVAIDVNKRAQEISNRVDAMSDDDINARLYGGDN